MKFLNLITTLSLILSAQAALSGPTSSGGVGGRSIIQCQGSYSQNRKVFQVNFAVVITPRENMGRLTVTDGNDKVVDYFAPVHNNNENPLGFVYESLDFSVLIPHQQGPRQAGQFKALVEGDEINNGKSVNLDCRRP
jgi:hypothetical protein